MANSEACQLFIEQQIKKGLEEGKTPYSIGKELVAMIEKLFKASIPAKTLEKKAERIRNAIPTNVGNSTTTQQHSEIKEKPEIRRNEDGNKFVEGTAPGPGRKPKYDAPLEQIRIYANREEMMMAGSQAMLFARTAILQLEKISMDDPLRIDALTKVAEWITTAKGAISC